MEVIFEEWTLRPHAKQFETIIPLSQFALEPFVAPIELINADITRPYSLSLPVSITPDLNHVMVPGYVLRLSRSLSNTTPLAAPKEALYPLDFDLFPGSSDNMPFDINLKGFHRAYHTQISDSGEFVLTIHRSSLPVSISKTTSAILWLLTLYQYFKSPRDTNSTYRYLTSLAFKPHYQ